MLLIYRPENGVVTILLNESARIGLTARWYLKEYQVSTQAVAYIRGACSIPPSKPWAFDTFKTANSIFYISTFDPVKNDKTPGRGTKIVTRKVFIRNFTLPSLPLPSLTKTLNSLLHSTMSSYGSITKKNNSEVIS